MLRQASAEQYLSPNLDPADKRCFLQPAIRLALDPSMAESTLESAVTPHGPTLIVSQL